MRRCERGQRLANRASCHFPASLRDSIGNHRGRAGTGGHCFLRLGRLEWLGVRSQIIPEERGLPSVRAREGLGAGEPPDGRRALGMRVVSKSFLAGRRRRRRRPYRHVVVSQCCSWPTASFHKVRGCQSKKSRTHAQTRGLAAGGAVRGCLRPAQASEPDRNITLPPRAARTDNRGGQDGCPQPTSAAGERAGSCGSRTLAVAARVHFLALGRHLRCAGRPGQNHQSADCLYSDLREPGQESTGLTLGSRGARVRAAPASR